MVSSATAPIRTMDAAKLVATVAVANVVVAMPVFAGEPGRLFDFNLTLPYMVTQFLLFMVFLEKFWFTPVGNVLDERDAIIRQKLSSVKDNSSDLLRLQEEAEAVLYAARTEVAALIANTKASAQAEIEESLAEAKGRVEKELAEAIKGLEKEKDGLMANVDGQVNSLTQEILRRVLPDGVKL